MDFLHAFLISDLSAKLERWENCISRFGPADSGHVHCNNLRRWNALSHKLEVGERRSPRPVAL